MTTGGSPFDPLFWMHHCNIDRVWDMWLNLAGGRLSPSDSAFLDQPYTFADETGMPTTVKVRDILLSRVLGYRYDDVPNPVSVVHSTFRFSFLAASSVIS